MCASVFIHWVGQWELPMSQGLGDSILLQVNEPQRLWSDLPSEAASSRVDPLSSAYHWLHLIIIPEAQAREWSRAGDGRRWVPAIRTDILFYLQLFQMWQGSQPTDLQGTVGGWLVAWVREECGAGCLGVSLCEEKPVPHAFQFSNSIRRGRAQKQLVEEDRLNTHTFLNPPRCQDKNLREQFIGRGQIIDSKVTGYFNWKEIWEISLFILLHSF